MQSREVERCETRVKHEVERNASFKALLTTTTSTSHPRALVYQITLMMLGEG